MRILFAFIFIFSLAEINGQKVKLNTLINGEVIHSSTILDSNEEIFCYFYLYDHGKVDKNVFNYRYVVLDNNLNTVTTGEFQEIKYTNAIFGALDLGVRVKYFKDKICIRIFEFNSMGEFFERFRYIDLKTNELSPNYQFRNDSLLVNKEIPRKNINSAINKRIIPANGVGFYNDVNVSLYDYQKQFNKDEKKPRKIFMYDGQFKLKWEHILVNKGQINLEKLYSDSSTLLFLATNFETKSIKSKTYSVKSLDVHTGVEKFDITFSGNDKSHKILKNFKVINGKLILYGLYIPKLTGLFFKQIDAHGLFKTEIDLNTGKILSDHTLSWKELGDYFKIPVYINGESKSGNTCPFVHEFVILNDDESVCVIEYYVHKKVKDIVFIKLDENLKPMLHERIEKENRTNISYDGSNFKNSGDFDYYFSQALSNENEFLFFFITNKSGASFFSKNNEYNILAYIDGKFEHQKIELKTGESQIYPMLAKKGYMLLLEVFEDKKKSAELRLERVNL
jgi:hypothetical protein